MNRRRAAPWPALILLCSFARTALADGVGTLGGTQAASSTRQRYATHQSIFPVEDSLYPNAAFDYPRAGHTELAVVAFPWGALRDAADWPADRGPLPDCARKNGPCLSVSGHVSAGGFAAQSVLQVWEGQRLRGWMDPARLQPAIYRLDDFWVIASGREGSRWVETGARFPTDPTTVRDLLRQIEGREPGYEAVDDHAAAGDALNRDVEAWVGAHGLRLDEARDAEEPTLLDRTRRLSESYFQAVTGARIERIEMDGATGVMLASSGPPGAAGAKSGGTNLYRALPLAAKASVQFVSLIDGFAAGYFKAERHSLAPSGLMDVVSSYPGRCPGLAWFAPSGLDEIL